MQNKSYSNNYSSYSTQNQRKRTKQRRSIFDIPEPVEPQRIRRIKIRRQAAANYRDKIRDIYHQTDYLANWRDEDLPCFIRPIEKTSLGSFLEKSKRSIYSKYQDISLRENDTIEQTDLNGQYYSNFEPQTNYFDENAQISYNKDKNQQSQEIEEEEYDSNQEEAIQNDQNECEEDNQEYIGENVIQNEEESETNLITTNEEEEISFDQNEEEEINFDQNEEDKNESAQNQQFANEDDLMPDTGNYDNFQDENDDVNKTDSFSHIEEEEEDNDDELALDDHNIEIDLYGVANVPTTMKNSHLFITFQQFDQKEDDPISRQIRIDKALNNTSVNLDNVHKSDILEILVWEENEENEPVLLGGLRLPLQSIDWKLENIQTFDLMSPLDLSDGATAPTTYNGNIALEFRIQ